MGFGNLGFSEILLILVVVLLLFGAKRLPEIGASFGKGIREFKRSISDTANAVSEEPPSSNRQLDSAKTGANAPTGGEPKRLSQ